MSVNGVLAVMLGGGIGAALRYVVASYVARVHSGPFPLGTFLINVTGSFAIGLLMTFFLYRSDVNSAWRLFLVTGVLGGYTTFSSFEWETLTAFKSGAPLAAIVNVLLSVVLGFIGVWIGAALIDKAGGR
jgi:fluoride exporter